MKKNVVCLLFLAVFCIIYIFFVNIEQTPSHIIFILLGWGVWFFLLYSYVILVGRITVRLYKENIWMRLIVIISYMLQFGLCYTLMIFFENSWQINYVWQKIWVIGLIILESVCLIVLEWKVKDIKQLEVIVDRVTLEKFISQQLKGEKIDTIKSKNVEKCILNNFAMISVFIFILFGNLFGGMFGNSSWCDYLVILYSLIFLFVNYKKYKICQIEKRRYVIDMLLSVVAFYIMKYHIFESLTISFPVVFLSLYCLTPFLLTFLNLYNDYSI